LLFGCKIIALQPYTVLINELYKHFYGASKQNLLIIRLFKIMIAIIV
jgi:hypothetical protein